MTRKNRRLKYAKGACVLFVSFNNIYLLFKGYMEQIDKTFDETQKSSHNDDDENILHYREYLQRDTVAIMRALMLPDDDSSTNDVFEQVFVNYLLLQLMYHSQIFRYPK
jgi:hypothetical protein